jgi:hypothetical protein
MADRTTWGQVPYHPLTWLVVSEAPGCPCVPRHRLKIAPTGGRMIQEYENAAEGAPGWRSGHSLRVGFDPPLREASPLSGQRAQSLAKWADAGSASPPPAFLAIGPPRLR